MVRKMQLHKQNQKEFHDEFSHLCQTKSEWQVWNDFVTISAIAISNSVEPEGERRDLHEKEYLGIIQQYDSEEQNTLARLFALTAMALEANPEQDFLGELFMGLNLNDHWKGQFFTPYHICHMMAEISMGDMKEEIETKGWFSINDPCCGAGALLVAARNVIVQRNIDLQNALFVAQDINRTVALMCYIQLSLLDCAGYVVVANSLTHPIVGQPASPLLISPALEQEVWIMPALYNAVWYERIVQERLKVDFSTNRSKSKL